MLARKSTHVKGAPLPQEWAQSVSGLLNETYAHECVKRGRIFEVVGQVYPDELVVTASFMSGTSATEAPVTCFLSCDPQDMSTKAEVKDTQDRFIELFGLFFDEIFASEEWNEWEPLWQEVENRGKTYWYKISRENVRLTLEADRLLRENGIDPDEDL